MFLVAATVPGLLLMSTFGERGAGLGRTLSSSALAAVECWAFFMLVPSASHTCSPSISCTVKIWKGIFHHIPFAEHISVLRNLKHLFSVLLFHNFRATNSYSDRVSRSQHITSLSMKQSCLMLIQAAFLLGSTAQYSRLSCTLIWQDSRTIVENCVSYAGMLTS